MTQIFHNGQPSRDGDRKIFDVMTSTLPKGNLGSVASLLAATLYQGEKLEGISGVIKRRKSNKSGNAIVNETEKSQTLNLQHPSQKTKGSATRNPLVAPVVILL